MVPEIKVDMTKVVEDFYSDSLKGSLEEISKIGVNAVKAVSLALFPLQFAGAYQDRLANWLNKAIRDVPSERRMDPLPSLISPIIEKIKYYDQGELLGEVYCELLSRAFDKERVKDAHPAFVNIISQLSPDEVFLISLISRPNGRIYFGRESDNWADSFDSISNRLKKRGFEGDAVEFLEDEAVDPQKLALPSYLNMYISHLQSLAILTYNNEHKQVVQEKMKSYKYDNSWWTIELSSFGKLFHAACVKQSILSGLKAEK